MAPVRYKGIAVAMLTFCTAFAANAQTASKEVKKHKIGSVYASWGYNTEWYTKSTVHVKQGELGNDYRLEDVKGHDHRGWDEKSIFRQPITIPQYNYRLGYYFNEKQDLAIELNFDHTKYIIQDGQTMKLKGAFGARSVDTNIVFSQATGSYYYLNNGANFFLFNIVKRVGVYKAKSRNLLIDLTGKAGIGPVIPHVQNSLFGKANDMGFQLGGWNTGLETALRITVMKYAYIEFAQKVDYARYSNLKVYSGRARQSFGCYELILSAGVTLPTTRNNPMFTADKAGQ